MNKTVKLALLAGAAGSVALGGYIAVQRHKNAQTAEIPTEIIEEQFVTVIEKAPEPKREENFIPKVEIETLTDDEKHR